MWDVVYLSCLVLETRIMRLKKLFFWESGKKWNVSWLKLPLKYELHFKIYLLLLCIYTQEIYTVDFLNIWNEDVLILKKMYLLHKIK